MVGPYDVEMYLLDRANIQDTIVRMMHGFDTRATSMLIECVYAPEVHLDYEPEFGGGKPEVVSSEVWCKRLEDIHDPYDSAQHVLQNLLIELPLPTATSNYTQRPDRCKTCAYVVAYFYNRDAEGRPRIMAMRNGVRLELDLVRLEGLKEKGKNPWRVTKQHVRLSWQDKAEE